jgi:hypothetical protein
MPTPRPDTLVTFAAVEKPACEDELVDLGIRHLLDFGFGGQTALDNLRLDPVNVDALTVITDLDDDVATFVIRGEGNGTLFEFAGRTPLLGTLQAVIGRVPDHVGQRILDHLQNLAVQFGIRTDHFQFDRLFQFLAEVAHDPRQLLPGIADRLHARRHDAFLQLGRHIGQALQRHLEFAVFVPADDFQKLVPGQHQLGHHGHQVFERVDRNADALVGDAAAGGFFLAVAGRLFRRSLFRSLFGCLRGFRGRSRCRLFNFVHCLFGVGLGGLAFGDLDLDLGLAERPLEFVEGDFSRTQGPLQGLVRHFDVDFLGRLFGGLSGRRFGFATARHGRIGLRGHVFELTDQFAVVAFRLFALGRFQLTQDVLDLVDRGQDQRNRFLCDRSAVAELAHEGFRGMGNTFEPGEAKEAAGALDGVHQTENVV